MAQRFSAFTLIDRITAFEPGRRAAGRFQVPAWLTHFRSPLVVEAIGQLAAWVAMAQFDFQRRPVAGLAGLMRYQEPIAPGQILEISVQLDSCDADAVAYGGQASVGGTPVTALEHVVGPMLDMEPFDDPQAVRADFATLRGPGAAPGRMESIPEPALAVTAQTPGEWIEADLQIPAAAPFFGDHFPRRPVYPGSLLLDAQIQLSLGFVRAGQLLREGFAPYASRSFDSKIRSFLAPGLVVKLRVERISAEDGTLLLRTTGKVDGKTVSSGRLEIVGKDSAA
jgi:3-hydroxymyristoyl/3-hydroxydecanoyl-(acyl carrier protein) dehydratase